MAETTVSLWQVTTQCENEFIAKFKTGQFDIVKDEVKYTLVGNSHIFLKHIVLICKI